MRDARICHTDRHAIDAWEGQLGQSIDDDDNEETVELLLWAVCKRLLYVGIFQISNIAVVMAGIS